MCDIAGCKNLDVECVYLGLQVCSACWDRGMKDDPEINLMDIAVSEGLAERTEHGAKVRGAP